MSIMMDLIYDYPREIYAIITRSRSRDTRLMTKSSLAEHASLSFFVIDGTRALLAHIPYLHQLEKAARTYEIW